MAILVFAVAIAEVLEAILVAFVAILVFAVVIAEVLAAILVVFVAILVFAVVIAEVLEAILVVLVAIDAVLAVTAVSKVSNSLNLTESPLAVPADNPTSLFATPLVVIFRFAAIATEPSLFIKSPVEGMELST